ncbi:MAG: hypothetical protein R2795_19605 [Saprospiraceae bacterium]
MSGLLLDYEGSVSYNGIPMLNYDLEASVHT